MFLNCQMRPGRQYTQYINALDATKDVAQSINYEIKQKQNEFLSKIQDV